MSLYNHRFAVLCFVERIECRDEQPQLELLAGGISEMPASKTIHACDTGSFCFPLTRTLIFRFTSALTSWRCNDSGIRPHRRGFQHNDTVTIPEEM